MCQNSKNQLDAIVSRMVQGVDHRDFERIPEVIPVKREDDRCQRPDMRTQGLAKREKDRCPKSGEATPQIAVRQKFLITPRLR